MANRKKDTMDSKSWLTVDDIMKDLHMPRKTSKRLDQHFIVTGKNPPKNLIGTEETEEDYIGHGGTGDEIATPDLGLIKKMIDLVNEAETCNKTSNDMSEDCVIEISKMKTSSKKFTTLNKASGDSQPVDKLIVEPKKIEKKPRHSRNVALTSIMQNMTESERDSVMNDTDHVLKNNLSAKQVNASETKLFKPTDFVSKKNITALSPTNMFRRKQKICLSPEQDNKSIRSSKSSPSSSSSAAYVPSSFAQEKYKEYMKRNTENDKEAVVNSYWEDIIQQMKDIDSKRSMDVEIDRTNHPQLTDDEYKRLGPVLLPMHRHHLTEDCIVCVMQSEKNAVLPKIITSTPELLTE